MPLTAEQAALAQALAQAMIDGFNRHYRLFRTESARGKHRFETADWHGQQRAQRERIEFYDLRVLECVRRLEREFKAGEQPTDVWQQAKLLYIGMLVRHQQPELAETFFNSVSTKILHRSYFQNDFIFVRPAVSTEYMETEDPRAPPTYRAFYPAAGPLQDVVRTVLLSFGLRCRFEDLERDVGYVARAMQRELAGDKPRPNFQVQVLTSLFYRNKGAYLVGKIINGFRELPFALPLLHRTPGTVYVDAALFGEEDLLILFSFSRAYFMVDMEIPSAYVQFLRSLMPRKPRAELYNALGLAKQGKNLFYRDLLWHLRHSSDRFRIAPGIKGMVMLVFDLPSFPYVFKIIRDRFAPPKETTPAQVRAKYHLVKHHDRVGRMADTMEFSLLAFPRERFTDELIAEIEQHAPSQLEISDRDGDGQTEVIIAHAYIERRMIPLNLYLQEAFDAGEQDLAANARLEHAVIEYGNAIKDLVAANIFPGDMLWKNFGVTRHGKVVFYDYDEIEYLTDCNFRRVPPPRTEEDELSGEVWYSVARGDVFPETFGPFLLGNPRVRAAFMRHHADLLTPEFWQQNKERIQRGELIDFYPYGVHRRFDVNGGIRGMPEWPDPAAASVETPADRPDALAPIPPTEPAD
ncbi:MAG: bifunctional isocitrate dehydrogenase kinase/phosphatase [Burkholderiaceae bacterium]|nr:bifunctional isocitrate dehydrogenase kinase/phosphatase [Pseudomonadota bacterium]MBS0597865.1 bifunctional isocitrate dehydrogenase kinase/phosphatase [Pseudomonadota bacterium]MCO5115934.1 bifunctional isocitrate dehydrogenase kinase/phosphatase [Burkholderiaceae bacterium]MCP5216928.1 bifunctional isocitrate dehydrogenase kinase/phosphatase [Burkholderiaceae bacterium]